MNDTSNRTLQLTHSYDYPMELMRRVWSQAEHITQWWGPKGHSNTIHVMDFKKDGEWKFIMHGPDNQNYANRSIFRDIVEHKKIEFEHFNPHFITTVTFEEQNNSILLTWNMLFDNEENFNTIVKTFKADEGLKQNLEKLETYLSNK